MFVNKEQSAYRYKLRIALLDEEHLADETAKFSSALFENAELIFFEETFIPMSCHRVFTDRRIFRFNLMLMKMTYCWSTVLSIPFFLTFTFWLDNDVSQTSKRRIQFFFNMVLRNIWSQFFIVKCFRKPLLFPNLFIWRNLQEHTSTFRRAQLESGIC